MQINAYAKINLTLDITGRRGDGYHLLRMVMQSVSLHDTLTLSKTQGKILVRCGREDVPCNESNTVYKAALAFFAYIGLKNEGIEIHIEKRIPSQAGLGGGSADAAAILHGLNGMFETRLSKEELCQIGLTVGTDVPFCICGGTALVEGVGELLTPLPPIPHCALVICKPYVGISTKEAYAAVDESGLSIGDATSTMMQALSLGGFREICASLGNAFSDILHVPEVEVVRQSLCHFGAENACMTGSGSAVFGIFQHEETARACAAVLQQEYTETYVCFPHQEAFK